MSRQHFIVNHPNYSVMKFSFYILLLLAPSCTVNTPESTDGTSEWIQLFDGHSLMNWDTYLGPEITEDFSFQKINEYPAAGINNDTLNVFSIVLLDDEPALRISGEIWGGISTKEEYENYHLQLKFKWGDSKWFPRDKPGDKRDSGLLYHANGPYNAGGFWLRSQEFQIQEGDCGDYWGVAGAMFDINARLTEDSTYLYDPEAPLITFREDSPVGRHCVKFPDNEKPTGEWNIVDLYCFGSTSIHVMNGEITMILKNSRQSVNGSVEPLTKGKIQLQSESAEVFYKDIMIRPINGLPSI